MQTMDDHLLEIKFFRCKIGLTFLSCRFCDSSVLYPVASLGAKEKSLLEPSTASLTSVGRSSFRALRPCLTGTWRWGRGLNGNEVRLNSHHNCTLPLFGRGHMLIGLTGKLVIARAGGSFIKQII